jgi:hypothetical protein
MPNLFEEFRAVVGVLSAARIPYAICGGIAMSIHAHPRATIDIDLLAPPDAVEQIVESLSPHGFVRRERAPVRRAEGEVVMHRLTKIVPGDPEVLSLDVIEVQPGATGNAWQTRTSTEWKGHSVTVVSRAGLIDLMGHDPRRSITIIVWSSLAAAPDGRAPAVEMAKAIIGHLYGGLIPRPGAFSAACRPWAW